jgi:hypothetical protein
VVARGVGGAVATRSELWSWRCGGVSNQQKGRHPDSPSSSWGGRMQGVNCSAWGLRCPSAEAGEEVPRSSQQGARGLARRAQERGGQQVWKKRLAHSRRPLG